MSFSNCTETDMATREQYLNAARRAHEAGDTDSARRLVQLAKGVEAPTPKPKPAFIPEPDIDLGADIRASGQPTGLVGDDFEPKGRVVRAPQPIVSAPMAREPLLTKPVDLPEPRPLESEAEGAIREATQAGLGR